MRELKMPAARRQRGAVMIVALMLLVVMTVLAVSGIGNSVLEQKMAGNYYHASTSFQAAEFGLKVAEDWLINNITMTNWEENWYTSTNTMGLNPNTTGIYTTLDGSSTNVTEVCGGNIDCAFDPNDESAWCPGGAGCVLPKGFITLGNTITETGTTLGTIDLPVARQPQFIVEHIGNVGQQSPIQFGAPSLPSPQTGFRITVIAWGQEGVEHTVLQSHVILPL